MEHFRNNLINFRNNTGHGHHEEQELGLTMTIKLYTPALLGLSYNDLHLAGVLNNVPLPF